MGQIANSSAIIIILLAIALGLLIFIGNRLVNPPEKRKLKSRKLVCIRTFAITQEAQIAQNYLKANGIEAEVFTSGGDAAYPGLTMTTGGARLMVDEKDKEVALRLLDK